MMRNLLSALVSSMVFFAGLHLMILGAMAINEGNPAYLNIFNILGIQEFLPQQFSSAPLGDIASLLFVGIVFVFFYLTKRKKT